MKMCITKKNINNLLRHILTINNLLIKNSFSILMIMTKHSLNVEKNPNKYYYCYKKPHIFAHLNFKLLTTFNAEQKDQPTV